MNRSSSSKQAILVLGPESSGTRLVTSIFIAAGCTGDDGHGQRFDLRMPHEPRVVWRRSYPHYHDWPDAREYIRRLRAADYDVSVAVTARDWHCMACPQVEAGHAESHEIALANIRRAYREIFAALIETDAPFRGNKLRKHRPPRNACCGRIFTPVRFFPCPSPNRRWQ